MVQGGEPETVGTAAAAAASLLSSGPLGLRRCHGLALCAAAPPRDEAPLLPLPAAHGRVRVARARWRGAPGAALALCRAVPHRVCVRGTLELRLNRLLLLHLRLPRAPLAEQLAEAEEAVGQHPLAVPGGNLPLTLRRGRRRPVVAATRPWPAP